MKEYEYTEIVFEVKVEYSLQTSWRFYGPRYAAMTIHSPKMIKEKNFAFLSLYCN